MMKWTIISWLSDAAKLKIKASKRDRETLIVGERNWECNKFLRTMSVWDEVYAKMMK